MTDARSLLEDVPKDAKTAVKQHVTRAEPTTVLTRETIGGLQIAKPDSFEYVNALIYGESGVGKTRCAGSACLVEEMSPVLLIDFEGGTMSLARDYGAVEVIRCKSWSKVNDVYGQLYDKNPYKTVVIDSLTETQKFSMAEIMRDVVNKAKTDGAERDPDVASVREWGKNGEQIRRLVRAFRDLPCNAIFTALVDERQDERTQMWKIRPGLPGKLKGEVAGYVDIVMYMYKKEVGTGKERHVETLALTQGTDRTIAKDRSGMLPEVMVSPDMRTIYNHIKGERNNEN